MTLRQLLLDLILRETVISVVDKSDLLIYRGITLKKLTSYPIDNEFLDMTISELYPYNNELVIVIDD